MSSARYLEADIIKRVAHIAPGLPGAQRRLATYVLDNAFEVASSSIESLAAATNTSVGTANRFACALGYSGYAEFRQALLQVFKPSMAPVEKLRRELGRQASPDNVVRESLGIAVQGLEHMRAGLSGAGVKRAMAMIAAARHVYCLGLGTSGYLADVAAFRFAPYCQSIFSLAGQGGVEMVLYHLQKIDAPDLLLTTSFPRYSADVLRIMRFARQRGAASLLLTDKLGSPLMALADHALFAEAEHPILSGSMVSALAMIEALAAAMAHRNPESLVRAAELTKQLAPYFYLDDETTDRHAGDSGTAAVKLYRANERRRTTWQ